MFTGLVTHKTKILSITDNTFTVENVFDEPLWVWQSIAHDGACMTVGTRDENQYSFFAMQESFDKTNFGKKSAGESFNLEMPMKAWASLDGHFVTWHIDTTWTISQKELSDDGSLKLVCSFDTKFDALVIPKGSIALNGVSLTVVDVMEWWCSVRLIPQTQTDTNLWDLDLWSVINIEFDMLGKYLVKRGRE